MSKSGLVFLLIFCVPGTGTFLSTAADRPSRDPVSAKDWVAELRSGNVIRQNDAKRRLRLYHFKDVAKAMSDFADDPNPEIRILMAQTLGELGGVDAVRHLKRHFNGEKEDRVRRALLIQLSGLMRGREALDFYEKILFSGSSDELRNLALTQASQGVRDRELRDDLKDLCYKVWRKDAYRPNRVLSGLVLKELGETGPDISGAVFEALQSPSVEIRRRAAGVAGTLEGPDVFQKITVALRDPDAETRANLCRSLKETQNSGAVPVLKLLAADADPLVRKSALDALTGFAITEVGLSTYREALKDADASVRSLAVGALECAADPAAVPDLEALAASDPDATVRYLSKKAVAVLSGGGR